MRRGLEIRISEYRRPKEIRSPNPEARIPNRPAEEELRTSVFGLLSDFAIRSSDFLLDSSFLDWSDKRFASRKITPTIFPMDAGILFFVLFAIVVVALGIYGALQARKRREELSLLAQRLGLRFSTAHDRNIPLRFSFLNRLGQGSNRYAFNVLSGAFQGQEVLAFDYHYETYSRDSKGRRQTHHHYFSFFILILPVAFPELTITRETIFSKIAQAIGFGDINFESHEFSRTFCVRSRDKRFAYDVCHAQTMEYLLANRDLNIEIEDRALAFGFSSCLAAEKIEFNLQRLLQFRGLMPDYLFSKVS
jgi:hypothetical protein